MADSLVKVKALGRTRTLIAAAAVAALVVFAVHFIYFPGSVPEFHESSGGGILLDQSPSFSIDETYERLENYGEAGRRSYVSRNLTVDVLLPLALLPFLFLLMNKAVGTLRLSRFLRIALIALPFLYVIFDIAENLAVIVLLKNYPERMYASAAVVPYFTSIKRAALFLALIVPLVVFLIRFVRNRLGNKNGLA